VECFAGRNFERIPEFWGAEEKEKTMNARAIMDRFACLKPDDDWPVEDLERVEACPVCGSSERVFLYDNLTDKFFNAPGKWTLYRCNECGSGYLDPRPTKASIGMAYREYFTHGELPELSLAGAGALRILRVAIRNGYLNRKYGYGHEPSVKWGYYAMYLFPLPLRLEWDHYARHLPKPIPGHNKLLDVGCGNGDFLVRARSAGWEVAGLDFDPKAAIQARLHGIEVLVGDYRNAPYEQGQFDVITADQVIEHVHDPLGFVSTIAGWLRPGGCLWIGTPNFGARLHCKYGRNYVLLYPPGHLMLFTPDSLKGILIKQGFKDVRIRQRGFVNCYIDSQSAELAECGCGNNQKKPKASLWRYVVCLVQDCLAVFSARLSPYIVFTMRKPSTSEDPDKV
jgi:SAM-dependent methyltransferase